jgi:large subunit ribosomal protein L22
MAQYGYSIKGNMDARAHAVVRDAPMSYKIAAMIGQRIKGMPAEKALRFLDDVQTKTQAVPYTRFNDSVGHRPGVGPGRYPQKAAKVFVSVLKNAVANAEDKGLGKEVFVEYVVGQQGNRNWRPGASGRKKAKRAHIEIVVTNVPQGKRLRHEKKARAAPKTEKTETKTTAAPKKSAVKA